MNPTMAAVKNGELLLSKEALKDLVRAVLEKKVPFRIRAKGFSMSPVIKDGDVIVITPLMDDQPGCGEVVAFLNVPNGTVAVHRVIKRSAGHYLIRGDNTRGPAETVTKERLLGRVKTVERNGKKVRFGLGP